MPHANIQDLFHYHPDPLRTGNIKPSDLACICCNQQRGYIYDRDEEEAFCPWCIADGSAAEKCNASFCHPSTLYYEGISKSIIAEINLRTPSYISWQEEDWLAHCDDACEYWGQARADYLKNISPEQKEYLLKEMKISEARWAEIMAEIPDSNNESTLDDPEIHLFVCRHCKKELYHLSYS